MEPDDERALIQAPSACVACRGGFGLFEMRGEEAQEFLHRVSTNDLRQLARGELVWTLLTTEKGRLIDLLAVGRLEDALLVACSEGNEESVIGWLEKFVVTENIQLRRLTAEVTRICLRGPGIGSAFSLIADVRLRPARPALMQAGDWLCFFCPDRWGGVALVAWRKDGGSLHERVEKAGIPLVTEQTWEARRITEGAPKLGHELDEAFNPYDVGLRDAISFTKGCYIGQEVIARLDTYRKVHRGLWGIVSDRPLSSLLRQPVFIDGKESGLLTSGTDIPVKDRYLGLAVLSLDRTVPGTRLSIGLPGGSAPAVAVRLPMDLNAL